MAVRLQAAEFTQTGRGMMDFPTNDEFRAVACPLLKASSDWDMIDSLFNQPNYLAAKRLLEATAVEQTAIASNIANVETPGYHRLTVSSSFRERLQEALQTDDSSSLQGLQAQIQEDPNAVASKLDGNNVELEKEMLELMRNSLDNALETQLLTGNMMRLRLAITGRT